MYQYEYVDVKLNMKFVGTHTFDDSKNIIDEYAKSGYRYVGQMPKCIVSG